MSVADSVLGLAQTVGFGIKDMQGLALTAGAAQAFIDIFFPGRQDSTLVEIHKSEATILKAVVDDARAVLAGVDQDFERTYLANVQTAQQTFGTDYAAFRTLGTDPQSLTNIPDDSWMAQSNLAPLLADVETMTGAASPLLDACNFIATLTERKFSTVQLYLLAATIYVNYCKFALMLVYTSGVPGYLATLSKYKQDHPDWRTNPKAAPTYPISFADQQSSIYLHRLRDRLGESLSYAKPIVDALQLKLKTKDDAVEKRARDFELKENASGKWYWEDVRQKVSSAPTDKEKASTGMTLAIGMAQAQEEKTQVVTLKLAGVDPGEVTKYRQTIDALDGALQDYPAAMG